MDNFPPTVDLTNAFPGREYMSREWWPGMTIRDVFAKEAMSALIAKIPLHDRLGEHGIHTPAVEDIHKVRQDIAGSAYDYADAMMAERNKTL